MKKVGIALSMALLAFSPLLFAGPAAAWVPDKPIHIIVGFSPGGGTDVIARALVAAGQEYFPVPLIVVNKPGAGGTLAAEYVAKAKPDGYTLLVAGGSESTSVPNFRKLPYSLNSFRAIMRAARLRIILASRANGKFKTLKEVVTYAKAHPGALSFGSSGTGTLYHATMLVFTRAAGITMKHVPYNGGAPELAALLGGHIDIGVGSPDEVRALYEGGKINLLALASNDRVAIYPKVPTLKELGYDVVIENMKGLVAPAGLPDDIYQYLEGNFKKAVESKAWKGLAKKMAIETGFLDGPHFMEAMKQMSASIANALK